MTRVYVNWETQKVIGVEQAEEIIKRKQEEYMDEPINFEDYLYENFTVVQVWEMDDKQKDKVLSEFSARQHECANEWFDNEFCEYEIE